MPSPQTPREAAEQAFYECEGNNIQAIKAALDAYEAVARYERWVQILYAAGELAAALEFSEAAQRLAQKAQEQEQAA